MTKGRPREFELDNVLDSAMLVFWQRGYEATSMQDLVDGIGINRASLYSVFGNKERLFLQVIDLYKRKFNFDNLASLEAETEPKRAIGQMFERLVKRLTDPTLPRGCLIANTSLEIPNGSESIARKISDCISAMEAAFYTVLKRAQIQGHFAVEEDARALARFFTGAAQGMAVMAKVSGDPSTLRDIVEVTLRVWPG